MPGFADDGLGQVTGCRCVETARANSCRSLGDQPTCHAPLMAPARVPSAARSRSYAPQGHSSSSSAAWNSASWSGHNAELYSAAVRRSRMATRSYPGSVLQRSRWDDARRRSLCLAARFWRLRRLMCGFWSNGPTSCVCCRAQRRRTPWAGSAFVTWWWSERGFFALTLRARAGRSPVSV